MKEIDGTPVEDLESSEQFDFLTYMLTKSGMTMKTLLQNTMDLLQAGIDTVSDQRHLTPSLSIPLMHVHVHAGGI